MQNQNNILSIDPLLPNSLLEYLFYYAEVTPSHDAVVSGELTLSYEQLLARVQRQVKALEALGAFESSVVGIRCDDDVRHLILCLATTYIGATSCTVPTYEDEESQQALIDACQVTIVVDETSVIDLTESVIDRGEQITAQPAKQACLLFATSGTTGKPKLVVHYDTDLVAQAHRHINSNLERFACRASMEHNFAKRHRLYCIAMGATNIFLSNNLESLVEDCQRFDVNVMHVSSFQAQELLTLPDTKGLPSIRLKLGGSHIPFKLREHLRASITPQLQAGYGTTETGAIAFTDPEDDQAGESVGQTLPGIEIRTVDEKRRALQFGEKGELAVRCKGMFRAYQGQQELTSQRLEDGWFYTGDIGYLDEQQRIHIYGRSDDMFTFNSMNIYPQEIEAEIRQYPDVIDAVVLPKPSQVHGNIPVALVVFNPYMKPDLPGLRKFVQKRVGVRSPRHYTVVDKIPTNTSGKISRLEASKLTDKSDQIREEMVALLDEKHRQHARASQIKDFIVGKRDLSFRKLQMDSLARMDLLVSLETQYDIVITPQELARLRTLGKLASRVLTMPKPTSAVKNQPVKREKGGEKTTGVPPYIVRFFHRLFTYCSTVTQLNQIFVKLEHRLTPLDVEQLAMFHSRGLLIPPEAEAKFHSAISFWMDETRRLMLNSNKEATELFGLRRVTPEMALFSGPNKATGKTLIIGFPPRDVRHLMMPNAVFLQHIDSSQYDFLMISEEQNNEASKKLSFGKKLEQQAQWLAKQEWFKEYGQIRVFGYSAGSFPALIFAYILNAELVLSIAGRFHKKKHVMINLGRTVTVWRAVKEGNCNNTIFSYSENNKRDRKFAQFFNKMCKAKEIAIKIKTEKLSHLMLRRLAERGELATYLAQTLFAKSANTHPNKGKGKTVLNFPIVHEQ